MSELRVMNFRETMDLLLQALMGVSCIAPQVGAGGISPKSKSDFDAVIFTIICGFLFFNWVLVMLLHNRPTINPSNAQYHDEFVAMEQFLKDLNVSHEVIDMCRDYYLYKWMETTGNNTKEVLATLHHSLRLDCLMLKYSRTLLNCPILGNVSPHCIRDISDLVTEEYFCKDSEIISVNDIFEDMFILHQGVVDVYNSFNEPIKSLNPGSLFGNCEKCLLVRSTTVFKAKSNCCLLAIKPKDLFDLSDRYPELQRNVVTMWMKMQAFLPTKTFVVPTPPWRSTIPGWILWCVDPYTKSKAKFLLQCCLIFVDQFLGLSYIYAISFYSTYLMFLLVAMDFFSLFLIYSRSYTPFHDIKTGMIIDDPLIIRKRYLQTMNFKVEVFSVLPVYWLIHFLQFPNMIMKYKYCRLLSLNKILHIIFFRKSWTDFLSRVDLNIYLFKSLETFFTVFLIVHASICAWHVVRCPYGNDDCFNYNQVGEIMSMCEDNTYLCSCYFVMSTLCTSAFGDVSPVTPIQIIFSILFNLASVFISALVMGDFSNIQNAYMRAYTDFDLNYELTKDYLRINKINTKHVEKVLLYCKQFWKLESGYSVPQFITDLPMNLKKLVYYEVFGKYFRSSFLFSSIHEDALRQMLMHLQRSFFTPGTLICLIKQPGSEMFLIFSGKVECLLNEEVIETLTSGAFFGLMAGLYKGMPQMYSYVAKSNVVTVSLKLDQWDYLLSFFPAMRAELYYRAATIGIIPKATSLDFFVAGDKYEIGIKSKEV